MGARHERYVERLHVIGYPRNRSCSSVLMLEELHEGICGSHTGGRLWPIELLPKDIGGRACKELLRIM